MSAPRDGSSSTPAGDARRRWVAKPSLSLLANRYLLSLALLILVMAGWSAISNMPRIEDPRITNRYPRVTTLLPGASADRVEALVTDPLEDGLEEISEIKRIESTSRSGISILAIELADDVGPDTNQEVFSRIRDRVSEVSARLPARATEPFVDDKASAVAFSLIASVEWRRSGEPALGLMNRLAEELADELRDIPGTDVVRLYGAPDEEISVVVDADELAAVGFSAASLAERIAAADPKLPAGAMRNAERDIFLEVEGELDSVARIASVPVVASGDGAVLTLGDIAEVRKDWRDPPDDIAYTDGARSILVAARTERDIRVDDWGDAARRAVKAFAERTGQGVAVEIAFDQSHYTEERLSSLGGNLFAGALVVMAVVFAGMGWRAALIVGSALPLSASFAVFGLSVVGQQIHQMSIFGMIIAIGLLIDNAIVMTDEVRKKLDARMARAEAVRAAVSHLFVPLLASTLTTILGFMPVFLLPGAMGDFVGPIAIAVVLALAGSFLISTTIIPALAGVFLERCERESDHAWWRDGLRNRRLADAYRRTLRFAVGRPAVAALACLVLPVSGFVLASTLGQEFFPPADRDQFEIEVWMPPEASLERTDRLARRISSVLREKEGVRQINWRIGGTYPTIYYNRIMKQESNGSYANGTVYTDTIADAKRLTGELPAELGDRFPEAQIVVSPFAQGPPVDSPVGYRITGPDVGTLKRLGDELRRIMYTVPGIVSTRATVTGGEPKLAFAADETRARMAGLSLTDVAAQLQTNLEGQLGGAVLEDLEELPVRIRYAESERDSVDSVTDLKLVSGATGDRWIPASGLGDIDLVPEAASISRHRGQRVNDVLGYIERGALAIDVTNAVNRRLEEVGFDLPPGYRLEVAGDSEEQQDAIGKLLTYLPVLLMLMAATIILSFRSLALAALIATVAVLSVGLGMLSLWIGGYARGFNAIIGSAGLIGVAINGTIVVLAAIRANPEAAAGGLAAIVEETIGATRHIVSTTFTTIGGFVPLLVFTGGDFWPPLAIVIAGGVGFSITLSLLFTPSVYRLLYGGRWSLAAPRGERAVGPVAQEAPA